MVLALMALRRAHLGVMLWVWSALFPPNEYLYGFAQGVPFNKIAVACTVVGLVMEKRRNFTFDLILTVLVMFLMQVTLAYFFSEAPSGWGHQYYEQLTKIVIGAFVLRFVVIDRTAHAIRHPRHNPGDLRLWRDGGRQGRHVRRRT